MSPPTFGFTKQSYKEVVHSIRKAQRTLQPVAKVTRRLPPGNQWRYAKSNSAISSGSLESPTKFTADVWVPDTTSHANPIPYVITTDPALLNVTVVNRSNMSGSSGVMMKIEWANGEWSSKWADC